MERDKNIPIFTTNKEIQAKINDLNYAKKACLAILQKDGCLVDMHGLSHWAERVEKLRIEIKEML